MAFATRHHFYDSQTEKKVGFTVYYTLYFELQEIEQMCSLYYQKLT